MSTLVLYEVYPTCHCLLNVVRPNLKLVLLLMELMIIPILLHGVSVKYIQQVRGVTRSGEELTYIYSVGGIVTFTATALLEDPDTIARAIERIDRHPLWACYIHPSVLSIFIRITCPDMDPIALFQTYVINLYKLNIFRLLTLPTGCLSCGVTY